MAEENDNVEEVENVEGEGKGKSGLMSKYSFLLKDILNYMVVGLIAALVSYFISTSVQTKTYSTNDLVEYETTMRDVFERRPAGSDWSLDEMLVNTADEVDTRIVKAVFVISYDDGNPKTLEQLSLRKTEIHSSIRNIVGSKKYIEVNTTEKQKIVANEIKVAVQRIIGVSGIIEIFIKEFMVH